MFNNIESIFILSGIGLYCLITLISNIVFWIEYFKAKEHKIDLEDVE